VLRYVEEVWNGHDLDAIDGLLSPEYFNHAASTSEHKRGGARRSVGWLLSLSVFPEHRFEVEDAAAEGETVALRGTMRGTHEGELCRASRPLASASARSSRTGSGSRTARSPSTGR
jgi:hypothetical protein